MPGVKEYLAVGPLAPVFPQFPQVSQVLVSSTLSRTVEPGTGVGVGLGTGVGLGVGEGPGLGGAGLGGGVGLGAAEGAELDPGEAGEDCASLLAETLPPQEINVNDRARTTSREKAKLQRRKKVPPEKNE